MTQEVRTMRGFVVLVVDDDTDNLELAARIVESFGCSVLKASSCADALAVLDSGAHVDLVFSDVVMFDRKRDFISSARRRWSACSSSSA